MLIVLNRDYAGSVIPLSIAKQHCRIDHSDEDVILQLFLDAAIEYLEEHTTLVGGPTLFEERHDSWDCMTARTYLSRKPIRDVVSISYLDEDDNLVAIADADWNWEVSPDGAFVYFGDGYSFPELSVNAGAVRIVYTAGFDLSDTGESGTGDNPDLRRPMRFTQAALLLTGHWYANRETVNVGNIVNNLPFAFDALSHQLRVFR